MNLYHTQSLGTHPRRLPQFQDNEPYIRTQGRWFTSFTSVKRDAIAYGESTFVPGHWELVSIDIADNIADSLHIATTPYTVDSLSTIDYTDKPETEYLVQTFQVMDAVPVQMGAAQRVRNYILANAPKMKRTHAIATILSLLVIDIKPSTRVQPDDTVGMPLAA